MKNLFASLATTLASTLLAVSWACPAQAASVPEAKPTIVLVHGAFADSSSWNGVVPILVHDGYDVIAAANPLRSVKGDAAYVHALLANIRGPVVLVGHSYGGMVISNAAIGASNVKALVYVAAFAPEPGEDAGTLDNKFPGSLLGGALQPPVAIPGGGHDLYVQQDKFHDAFAPDLPVGPARVAGTTQRPITDIAFGEKSASAAWKTIPSWFVYGDGDTAIPPKALGWMAERAHARETVVVKGASHIVMVTHAKEVVKVIEDAAATVR
ncbi:MAG: alpha/beta hydrolase [Alphaproteobacteria bacterium]|nr:alpha/beta hydrolase [Alphaproteobacteria bacterium]